MTSHRAAVAALLAFALLAGCAGSGSDRSSSPTGQRSTTGQSTTRQSTTSTTTKPEPAGTIPDDRPIDVRVPSSYRSGTPAPLLVLLHGYGASGAIQTAYLRLLDPVDKAGMLFVAPDGSKNAIGKQFWNATDACCAPPNSEVDDVAYLSAVIGQVKAQYDVDPDRVYLVGHSNGGFMAYRMACDRADLIAAVVSLEGATFDDPDDCEPSEGVATLQVHGRSDTTILFDGGDIMGRTYPGAQRTVDLWAAANGCRPTADDPPQPDRQIVADLPPASVITYSKGCDPGGYTELWDQPEGVHIPAWSDSFATQVVEWLQAHPKP